MTGTLETPTARGAAIEKKKKEAREFSGVTFDPRINRFTAAITIDGKRTYLGAFATAEEAGAAYMIARSENPISRKHNEDGEPSSFAAEWRRFLKEEAEQSGKPFGFLQVGALFMAPGNQIFQLQRIDYRFSKKGKKERWVFYVWGSNCRACNAWFETRTVKGQHVTGMTRNCAEHLGQRGSVVVRPSEHAPKIEYRRGRAPKIEQPSPRSPDVDDLI